MPLLQGFFDPTLFNSIVLAPFLSQAMRDELLKDQINLVDVMQSVIQQMVAAKIIR